jgi:L-amino acid N-acyltransferase YncA
MPETECFLEYLWVAERKRRSNIGYKFISEILSRLQRDGVRTVLLWVLDGNEAAVGLYRKAGFEIAGPPTPLEDRPGRTEQLWRRELPEPGLPDQIWPGIRQE